MEVNSMDNEQWIAFNCPLFIIYFNDVVFE